MAKETKILKLYQVTRPEDDDKAFNIQTMLNDNWDKIDKAFEKSSTAEAEEGTNTEKIMTPKTTKDAILKLAPQLEYKDILNLSATPSGAISWSLPQSTDNTRTAIVLCRATKDISNMDYAACLADASITKNTLAQNATSNTYTGLTNATQYWVKAFVKYALGGKEFYSGGVTVTFTTPNITEFYNAGNEFTAVTGGWKIGTMGGSGTVVKNTSNAVIGSPLNSEATIVTTNLISLSPIKTLKFEMQFTQTGNGKAFMGVSTESQGVPQNPYATLTASTSKQIRSLDVTNVNSNNYISIYLNSPAGSSGNLILYRVWGES